MYVQYSCSLETSKVGEESLAGVYAGHITESKAPQVREEFESSSLEGRDPGEEIMGY